MVRQTVFRGGRRSPGSSGRNKRRTSGATKGEHRTHQNCTNVERGEGQPRCTLEPDGQPALGPARVVEAANGGVDLLLSCVLLVLFVLAVEITAVGSVGDGIVGLFGGLFTHPDATPWPMGVQEDDDQRLVNFAALRRWAGWRDDPAHVRPMTVNAHEPWGFDELSEAWPTAEFVDDVPAVPVSRVHRTR